MIDVLMHIHKLFTLDFFFLHTLMRTRSDPTVGRRIKLLDLLVSNLKILPCACVIATSLLVHQKINHALMKIHS